MPVMREIGFTALSAAGSIVVLFLLAKLIGARQVSQMTMFDYVVELPSDRWRRNWLLRSNIRWGR